MSTNGTITTVKPDSNSTTAALSWKNVMNIFNVFDFRVSFALIRENLGTLLSVSEELKYMFITSKLESLLSYLVMMFISLFFLSTDHSYLPLWLCHEILHCIFMSHWATKVSQKLFKLVFTKILFAIIFVSFIIFLGVFLDKLSVYTFCLLESEWLSLQLHECIIWLLFCLVLFLTKKQIEEQFSILKTVEKCCINPSPVLHTWRKKMTCQFNN